MELGLAVKSSRGEEVEPQAKGCFVTGIGDLVGVTGGFVPGVGAHVGGLVTPCPVGAALPGIGGKDGFTV